MLYKAFALNKVQARSWLDKSQAEKLTLKSPQFRYPDSTGIKG